MSAASTPGSDASAALIDASVVIHQSAIVDAGARIGAGTKVWHFVHISPGAQIGARCVIGQGCYVGGGAVIADGVKIQNNVSVYDAVHLDDDVFVGPSAVFTNVVNPRSALVRKHEYKKTHVQRGASIGANATIVCGVTIGSYAFIGAGAVVTRNVPPFALMVGTPARRTGWMCRCGVKLPPATAGAARCTACAATYALAGAGRDETCTAQGA